jgi:hypothetical protein
MMNSIVEVKEFLDEVVQNEVHPVVAETYRLDVPGLTIEECQWVENQLNIQLPESYRHCLIKYDWNKLELGYLRFYGDAQRIVYENRESINASFYRIHNGLEIATYEADTVCVCLERSSKGRIFYINHNLYPEIKADFVSSGFETFVICAVTDLKLKKEVNYYQWNRDQKQKEGEKLYDQINKAIISIEPRANESDFWYKFIRGI